MRLIPAAILENSPTSSAALIGMRTSSRPCSSAPVAARIDAVGLMIARPAIPQASQPPRNASSASSISSSANSFWAVATTASRSTKTATQKGESADFPMGRKA